MSPIGPALKALPTESQLKKKMATTNSSQRVTIAAATCTSIEGTDISRDELHTEF